MKSEDKRRKTSERMAPSRHEGRVSGKAQTKTAGHKSTYSSPKRILAFVLALAMVLSLVYVDGKRKAARADETNETEVMLESGTIYQVSETFTDSKYLDFIYGEGKTLYDFVQGYKSSDKTEGITIYVPKKEIKLGTSIYGVVSDGVTKVAFYSNSNELDSTNVESATALTELVADDSEAGKTFYIYSYDKNSEGIIGGSFNKIPVKLALYTINSLKVTKEDYKYYVSDADKANDPNNYTFVYGKKAYDNERNSSTVINQTEMQEKTTSLGNKTITEVGLELSVPGDSYDGDYVLYKQILSYEESPRVIYMYGAKFTRDDYVNFTSPIKVYNNDTSSEIISNGTLDLSKEDISGYITGNTKKIYFTYKSSETTKYSVIKGDNTVVSLTEVSAGNEAMISIPVTTDDVGQTVNYIIKVESENKEAEEFKFAVIYNDGTPSISIVKVGGKEATLSEDGNYSITLNSKNPTLSIEANAGGKSTLESISVKKGEDEVIGTLSGNIYSANLSFDSDSSNNYSIIVKNNYGKTIEKSLAIGIDTTGPVIDNLIVSDKSENFDKAVSEKKSALTDFDFSVDITDSIAGVNDETVKAVATCDGKETVTLTGVKGEGAQFKFNQPAYTQYEDGSTVKYTISAMDKIGNAATEKVFYVTYCNETITIEYTLDPEKDTTENFIPTENKDTVSFKLTYDIESGVVIKDITDASNITINASDIPDGVTVKLDKFIPSTLQDGKYITKVEYIIEVSKSAVLENIKFSAENGNGKIADKTIDIINIDLTKPTADWTVAESSTTGRKDSSEHQWYRNLAIIATFNDEAASAYNSGIDDITLTGINESFDKTKAVSGTTVYTVKSSDAPNIGTAVKLTVTDKAGNISSKEETYYVDGMEPKAITSLDISDINSDDFVREVPDIKVKLSDEEDSLYRDIVFVAEKWNAETSTYASAGSVKIEETTEKNATKKLSEIIENPADGKYKVTVYVADYGMAADSISYSISKEFTLDTKSPVVDMGIAEQIGVENNSILMTGEEETFDAPKKLTSTKGYSVRFKVTDDNLSTVKINNADISVDGDGYYTVNIADASSFKGTTQNYKVVATDKAGREIIKTLAVSFLDDKLSITGPTVSAGVSLDSDNNIITKTGKFDIVYVIETDAAIDETGTLHSVSGDDKDKVTGTLEKVSTDAEDTSYSYKYNYTVSVDAGSVSAIMDTLKFTAKNINGISADAKIVNNIKIDQTAPTISIKEADASGKTPSEESWYKELTLYIEYSDGDKEYISNIAEEGISITGEGVDVSSVTNNKDASGNVTSSIVKVKESTDASTGSNVVISVTDRVGNNTSEKHTFFVDSTAPDKLSLNVEGKDISSMTKDNTYLKDYPTVSYEVNDNLQIKDATITTTLPDEATKTTNLLEGSTEVVKSITGNKTISELADVEKAADGVYTISISANDNIDAKHSKDPITGSFTLDNTAPTLGDVVIKQSSSFNEETQNIDASDKTFAKHLSANGQKIDFTVDIADTNLDTTKTVVTNSFNTDDKVTISSSNYSDGKLTFSLTPDSTYQGKTVTYTVDAWDKAGNETKHTFTITFLSDDLKVSYEVIDYDDYKAGTVNLTNDNSFVIRFTVETDAELNTDNTKLTQTTAEKADEKYDASLMIKDASSVVDKYKYTYDYKVDLADGESLVIDNLKLAVESVNGIKGSATVSVIKVDYRKPNLGLDSSISETDWYKNLEIVVSYDDSEEASPAPAYASGVKSVTVSQNGKAANDITESKTVTVEQSPSVDGTPIVFTVTDNVGNVTKVEKTIHVDGVNPEGEFSVKFKGADAVNDNYYTGDPDVTVKLTDDIKVASYELKIEGPSEDSSAVINDITAVIKDADISKGVTNKLSDYVELEDGKYTITFSGKDLAGNEYTPEAVTFNIDNTDPVIEKAEVIQSGRENNLVAMSSKEEDTFTAPIMITTQDSYKVAFGISDTNVKSVVIKEEGVEKTYTNIGNVYTVAGIENPEKYQGKSVKYEITLTDKAGTSVTRTLIVEFLAETIEIERSITNYNDKNVKVNEAGNIITNVGKFDVVYKITSDAPIEKAEHTATGADKNLLTKTFELNEDESDAAAYRYVYYYTIKVDLKDGDSAVFGKLSLDVENINGVKASGETVNDISIDLVAPTFTIHETDASGRTPDERTSAKWYKTLPIYIEYDEGKDPYISNITDKDITIEGVSDIKHSYDENGFVTSTTALVDETKVVLDGSTVKITVRDEVGNETTETHIYLVDSTDPSKLTLTVDGDDINGMTLDKNYIKNAEPEIKYEAYDNLQIKETVLTVTAPGEEAEDTVTEGLITDGKNDASVSVIGKLADIAGTGEDGEYSFVLTATDNAGNVIEPIKGAFTLDNTAPVIADITAAQPDVEKYRTVKEEESWAGASAEHDLIISFGVDDPSDNKSNSESGLASVVVTEQIGDNEAREVVNTTYENSTKNEITKVTIKPEDTEASKAGQKVTYVITAKDRLGNETVKTFTVSYIEDKIEVSHTFANTTETNSKVTKVTFRIVSDAPVVQDGVSVTSKLTPDDGSIETAGILTEDKAEDDNYEYTYEYTITASDSKRVDNIACTVTNVNGAVSNTDSISYVYIDLRDPGVTLSDTDQIRWTDSLRVVLQFSDDAREFKSGVKDIKVTGVKQDAAGAGYTIAKDRNSADSLNGYSVTVDVNESKSLNGTPVEIIVTDQVGNTKTFKYTFHVDETNPEDSLSINDRTAAEINGTYIGTESLDPAVAFTAKDNIQVRNYTLNVKVPSGETIKVAEGNNVNDINISTTLGKLIGNANLNGAVPKDGQYTVTLTVTDMAGRVPEGGSIETSFMLDNTTPKNDLQITTARPAKFDKYKNAYSNEATGLSYEYGQYYAENVAINAIVVDNNVASVTVTDNGSVIYSGSSAGTAGLVISAEGSHTVTINTTDRSGLRSVPASVSFTIDKTAPVLSTSLNASAFAEGAATRYLNVNGDVNVSVSETNKDAEDLNMTVTKTPPNSGSQTSTSKVSEGSQVFSDEADYSVKFQVIDRAGNRSAERTVNFRVDKTAPELRFSGAVENGTSTENVTMTYAISEAFYSDMNSCTVRVYKKVDGASEVLLRTIDVTPNSSQYTMTEQFEEDGEYRFEMTAEDKCGNSATTGYTFILDGEAPVITLAGVKNFDKTDEAVTLGITVDETFFSSNKVVLKGTRVDIDGRENAVEFDSFNVNGSKVSTFEQLFEEDGIYDITVDATDRAGNKTSEKVHFTIDTAAPEIGSLDKYDGTRLNEFVWDTDYDKLVKDLTVCDIKIYLDGVEYDGVSGLADGSHVLRVVATDELGHTTEKEVSFLLDTIAPNIIVTNVEEGTVLKESTDVTVSVQLDEDRLTSVTLNGEPVEISGNVASFTVDSRGAYTLEVTAEDDAGNVSSVQMHFSYGSRFPWWIIVAGAAVILGGFFIILAKRRKKDEDEK